jgi:glycerophosphodiester phosphodiesterase
MARLTTTQRTSRYASNRSICHFVLYYTNHIQLQVNEGIDAVIVDSVLAIRKGLTGSDQQVSDESAVNGLDISNPAVIASNEKTDAMLQDYKGREVVETVNGVPIYADGGLDSSTAAIFI